MLSQILFILLVTASLFLAFKNGKEIYRNIKLGRKRNFNGPSSARWKNLFLLAFGQKKMFQRPIPALLHFVVYAGFIIINIEMLEIVLDGILGTHRLFAPKLGNLYPV
ncbi:MAG TPA: hypothetical protein VK027_05700, partial [Chitinophagaceae bacterium]|nr:hypothetical protein [Chitinophagaceae bacterium]